MSRATEEALEIDKKLAVMRAWLEGKSIQYRRKDGWTDCNNVSTNIIPAWNWSMTDYRVKPEPSKPKEIYVNEYSNGMSPWASKEEAVRNSTGNVIRKAVLYREVICECEEKS